MDLVLATEKVSRDKRFYCRKVIVRNLGLDDWIMFIALVRIAIQSLEGKYG